ncbi:MAG: aspartate-semialdehyde dehydrogenase [Candidatus Jacksonbacteria bacterium]
MHSVNIAILGATGMVGQRFVSMLAFHPYFKIKALLASENSDGRLYSEACNWLVSPKIPEAVKSMIVKKTSPESLIGEDVEIVFSALPSEIAKEVEPKFAGAGIGVFSNASSFRMEEDVPLVVAEINADHMELVKVQQANRGWKGFIVTNPNCTTIVMCLPLKALDDGFGVKKVIVSTMQAVSGAGYPGVASLDIVDNVLPYISGEEEKVEGEPLKIMGQLRITNYELRIKEADIKISASCQRVPVIDGHLEDLHVSLKKPATIDEIKTVLYDFGSNFKKLPTSPKQLIIVNDNPYRPQPKLDRDSGNGMSITVGRIRKDPVLENGVKMSVLGHNTIRGAAGQSILNAEWWVENSANFPPIRRAGKF